MSTFKILAPVCVLAGLLTSATVAANAPSDFDRDGDVDATDFAAFRACGSRAGVPVAAGCGTKDLDGDGDVDVSDFGIFQTCYSGANHPAAPACTPPIGMVFIPAGTFQMGDSFGEGAISEVPVHTVTLSGFFLDRTEVTNEQYKDALNWARLQSPALIAIISNGVYKPGSGTSYPYCDTTTTNSASAITWNGTSFGVTPGKETHPMVLVTWQGSAAYANWRSVMHGRQPRYNMSTLAWIPSTNGYRLPTDAEWEWAARGGHAGRRFPWSETDTIQHARANYNSMAGFRPYDDSPTRGFHPTFNTGVYPYTNPVAYFAPNDYGLYDMAGNVWEWCNDIFGYYTEDAQTNPTGPTTGGYRVLRGGSWLKYADNLRCAARSYEFQLNFKTHSYGFRLARAME